MNHIKYKVLKKRHLKKKNLVLLIILIFSFVCFFFSLYNLFSWIRDNNNINKQTKNIIKITNIEEIKDSEETVIVNDEKKDKFDPYWDYIKMNLIDVDFNELKKINNDTKGWIQVSGTNVNYPFVQSDNNEFYLNHSFDKSSNGGGWVFLDYRNNIKNEDKNTIIYGHGRQNKTIFGSLKNLLNSDWINNTDNFIIKISTEYENTLWQIFSMYRIPTINDYIQVTFNNNDEFINFSNMLLNRSQYNFNTSINEEDRILTLSTCYNNEDKFVIHAKLIKKELK